MDALYELICMWELIILLKGMKEKSCNHVCINIKDNVRFSDGKLSLREK